MATPIEKFAEMDDLLGIFVESQKSGPLSTPEIMEMLMTDTSGAIRSDELRIMDLAALLATAIQRLGAL